MQKIVVGLIAAVAMTGSAFAADMAPRYTKAPPVVAAPVFSWTGCYIGGFVGGAGADRNSRARDLNGYNAVGDTWFYGTDNSFIGGGTLGCNYQTGAFVLGVEGEAGYLRVRGSALDPFSPFLPLDTRASTAFGDWYGVIAGRAGVAVDRALFYVKGGAAFVNTSVSTIDANPAGGNTITATAGDTRATWALGGGIEYALTNNWTIKGEYLYIDTRETLNACGFAAVGGARFCWSHDVPGLHTAKLGLNYKFDWAGPVVAKY
ncbi:MAG: porin family protein [Rhizobiales bacterium]|nr:porin family protein [Hyphomicrobiales bacterium]